MKSVIIHDAALCEIESAATWYESKSEDLGLSFFVEIERSVEMVGRHPEAWPNFIEGTRQFVLKRFPYSLVYRDVGAYLEVVAVRHHRQQKDYWTERLC